MYRFLALLWNPDHYGKTATARTLAKRLQLSSTDWECVLKCKGLQVFHAGARDNAIGACRLDNKTGVVLGTLFHRPTGDSTPSVSTTFGASESRIIIDSHAKHLAEAYWGRYVAFLWDEDRQRHCVFRDPTGGLPCIFTSTSGISVFMSDMDVYLPLEAGDRSVDWKFISALFWNQRLITRETGFEEVSRLHAGECMIVTNAAMTSSFHWDPARVYAAGPLFEAPERAKAELKSVVEHCVQAWASCHDNIIHLLSGGLDSSIVASCLRGARDKTGILCVNFSTETQDGDERVFARLAAQKDDFELIEGNWHTSEQPLERLLDSGMHAAPFRLHSGTDRLLEKLTRERGAAAVFSGQGGDHLFQQRFDPLMAADYVWQHGLRHGLAAIVVDTSRITGKSVWHVLEKAFIHGLLKRKADYYAVHRPSILLTEEARAALPSRAIVHPWVERRDRVPPSKNQQIYDVVDAQHFYLRPLECAETIHPLISQPIIECCLKIPTYVLARRGVPRGLVREAFRDELPREIADRTSKGDTTGYLNRLAVENAVFLRNYLLDGMLVSARILDKRELEKQLADSRLIHGELLFDVYTAVRTEAWLRNWAEIWRKAAA